jgi:hypothetical protein
MLAAMQMMKRRIMDLRKPVAEQKKTTVSTRRNSKVTNSGANGLSQSDREEGGYYFDH